jgi:hypothetical protein
MKRYLTFYILSAALAALLFSSCGPASSGEEADDGSIADLTIVPGERVGLITLDKSTQAVVLAAYGDSARVDSIYVVEGMTAPGVIVFPDNPLKMLEIYWDREIDPLRPALIRISGAGPVNVGGSSWKTTDGITIGTSLEEVERLNGKPFDLYGFDWDYGGLVTDWKEGKQSPYLHLRFQLTEVGKIPSTVLGETVLKSNDPVLRRLKPVVAVIELSFPRSDPMPLMQGRWRSDEDPNFEIEIKEGKIRHYIEGELLLENSIEADRSCENTACSNGEAPALGWCFIEKGAFDMQCMLLLSCDGARLEYTLVGSTGKVLVFTKVG